MASGGAPLPAGTPILILSNTQPAGGFIRDETQIIYRNANRVISIQMHTIADAAGNCKVQGTAVPAS